MWTLCENMHSCVAISLQAFIKWFSRTMLCWTYLYSSIMQNTSFGAPWHRNYYTEWRSAILKSIGASDHTVCFIRGVLELDFRANDTIVWSHHLISIEFLACPVNGRLSLLSFDLYFIIGKAAIHGTSVYACSLDYIRNNRVSRRCYII